MYGYSVLLYNEDSGTLTEAPLNNLRHLDEVVQLLR